MSDSLWPHELQDARLFCSSLSPGACSNSCPLSWWCHPSISSSDTPFSSHLQSFPSSESFPMSGLFASGGQSIGTSASVLPVTIWSWFPLGLTGLISLLSKGLSRVFCSATIQKHQFFGLSHLYGTTLTSVHDYWKNHSFDCLDLCWLTCSLSGFSVHGIFKARVLEWVAISFSRESSLPGDWTQVSRIVGSCFTLWATREAQH